MKIQTATIVYILIIIPILFVLTVSISLQTDTLKSYINYERIQTEATKDGIQAFEINTSGEDHSKVSDVLRSIVEASVNVYMDSLATKMGRSNMSREYIEKHTPFVIFTLYDGFYVSAPAEKAVVATDDDGNALNVDDEYTYEENGEDEPDTYKPALFEKEGGGTTREVFDAKKEIEHQMSQLQLYTARASLAGSGDPSAYANINFSLDNYLVINGKINDITFNKSGYLLNRDTEVTLSTSSNNLKILEDENIGNEKLVNAYVDEARKNGDRIEVTVRNDVVPRYSRTGQIYGKQVLDEELIIPELKIVYDPADDPDPSGLNNPEKNKEKGDTKKQSYYEELNDYNASRAYADQQIDAIKYYLNAIRFSNWVYGNLSNIQVQHLELDSDMYADEMIKRQKASGEEIVQDSFDRAHTELTAGEKLFEGKITDELSNFNIERKRAIVSSIKYAMELAYNNYDKLKYDGNGELEKLLIVDEKQWDNVANNIAMITYLEGVNDMPSGSKHTSYSIISSTDNDYNVTENNLVYVPKDGLNKGDDNSVSEEDKKYYSIDADIFNDESKVRAKKMVGRKITDFKYDGKINKILRKPIYAFKNFEDISNIMPPEDVKKDGEHMYNDIQKQTLMLGLTSEKQRQLKLSKYVDDATFEVQPSTDALRQGGVKAYSVRDIAGVMNGDHSIKNVTITYEIEREDETEDEDFSIYDNREKYLADITIKMGNQEYMYTGVAQTGDALSTITIKNGLERREGKVNYVPFEPVDKISISFTLRDSKGNAVTDDTVKMNIKEVTFETY